MSRVQYPLSPPTTSSKQNIWLDDPSLLLVFLYLDGSPGGATGRGAAGGHRLQRDAGRNGVVGHFSHVDIDIKVMSVENILISGHRF